MSACARCGSFAINPGRHGRDDSDLDLCDVCYWRRRAPAWRPPETAPRDMSVFLGDFGFPWPLPAVWNPVNEKYCAAALQIDMYEGKHEDSYFENECLPASELRRWMPLPNLPTSPVDNLVEKPMTDLRQQGAARVEKTLSRE